MSEPRTGREPETIAEASWVSAVMWVGFPIAGILVVGGLKLLANSVVGLPWVPFQGPLELIASLPEPVATIGAVVLGLLAGLVLAVIGKRESVSVTVGPERVVLNRGGTPVQEVAADQMDGAFVDGKQLVLLGRDTAELMRQSTDLNARVLADAFPRHGYRWLDGDPYEDRFRRWVAGTSELPAAANALLKAREQAVGKGDAADDANALRDELAALGVVVRDRRKQQHWRFVER